ncbi:MAG: hypothetical protein WCP34_16795, partial [Pseudomonadota bacterium]
MDIFLKLLKLTPSGQPLLAWRAGEQSGTSPLPNWPPTALEPGAPESCRLALTEVLPGELVESLSNTGGRLLLDPALPDDWHSLPWEHLRHRDLALTGRLLAVRRHPVASRPAAPVAGQVAVLNLWRDSSDFAEVAASGLPVRQIANSRLAAGRALAREDWTQWSALVVITHGGERAAAPFLEESQKAWDIPWRDVAPPLVILLACASRDGNLADYATRLLDGKTGVRTLLVPLGQLDAGAIAVWLRHFLADWLQTDRSIGELLQSAQGDPAQRHGAARLALFGEPDLYWGNPAKPFDDAASLAHATRRTWFQAKSEEDFVTQAGYEALRALTGQSQWPLDHVEESLLFRRLTAILPENDPATRHWLHPRCLYLAERHDHATMSRLLAGRGRDQAAPPALHHAYAKGFYRRGDYPGACQAIEWGLAGGG